MTGVHLHLKGQAALENERQDWIRSTSTNDVKILETQSMPVL